MNWIKVVLIWISTWAGGYAGCLKENGEARALNLLLGMMVPECENGTYAAEQCNEQLECWCVTEDGREIPNTRITDQSIERLVDCQEERMNFVGSNNTLGNQLLEHATMMNSSDRNSNTTALNCSDQDRNCSQDWQEDPVIRAQRQANNSVIIATTDATGNQIEVPVPDEGGNVTATNQSVSVTIVNVTSGGGPEAGNQPANVTTTNQTITTTTNVTSTGTGEPGNVNQTASINQTTTNVTATAIGTEAPEAGTAVTTIRPLFTEIGLGRTVAGNAGTTNVVVESTMVMETGTGEVIETSTMTGMAVEVGTTIETAMEGNVTSEIETSTSEFMETGTGMGLESNITTEMVMETGTTGESVMETMNTTGSEATGTEEEMETTPPFPATEPGSVAPGGELSNETCGPNTVYSLCASPCPTGCDQQDAEECTMTSCHAGCVCAPRYIRQRSNDTSSPCVKVSNCGEAVAQPSPAERCRDPNARWSNCGTPCEETCTFRPVDCPSQCAVGCFCRVGFVREANSSSPCIPREQCVQAQAPLPTTTPFGPNQPQPYQQQCPDPNAMLSNCGSACEETCDYKPTTCALPCTSGCFCKEGFVKETRSPNARCVRRDQCGNSTLGKDDPRCPDENSSWLECGTSCPETCKLRANYCTTPCAAGCFCNQGFVKRSRRPNAKCVPRTECKRRGQSPG